MYNVYLESQEVGTGFSVQFHQHRFVAHRRFLCEVAAEVKRIAFVGEQAAGTGRCTSGMTHDGMDLGYPLKEIKNRKATFREWQKFWASVLRFLFRTISLFLSCFSAFLALCYVLSEDHTQRYQVCILTKQEKRGKQTREAFLRQKRKTRCAGWYAQLLQSCWFWTL